MLKIKNLILNKKDWLNFTDIANDLILEENKIVKSAISCFVASLELAKSGFLEINQESTSNIY